MWFFYLITILSLVVQAVFATLAIAAGLYYLAELVEEYTVMAKYIISWMVAVITLIHIGLLLFEELPLHLDILGICQQALHALLLREFPAVRVASAPFVTAVGTLVAHHYYALKYFGTVHHEFSESVNNIGLLVDELPLHLDILGICQQALHALLLREFPAVRVASAPFVTAVGTLVAHHYYALKYFGTVHHEFSEVLAYFTLCLWVVPFALFVSLSANDYVLPTTGEKQPLLSDNNVVTDYLSRKSKRYSLLSFFSFAKDSILPQRSKKAF